MTTETKTPKAIKTTPNDELAKVLAELEALKADKAALEAKLAAKTTNPERADWQREPGDADFTAGAETELGKAQRLERAALLQVVEKTLRAIPYREVPAVLEDLAKRAAQSKAGANDATDEKVSSLIAEKVKVRGYTKKTENNG